MKGRGKRNERNDRSSARPSKASSFSILCERSLTIKEHQHRCALPFSSTRAHTRTSWRIIDIGNLPLPLFSIHERPLVYRPNEISVRVQEWVERVARRHHRGSDLDCPEGGDGVHGRLWVWLGARGDGLGFWEPCAVVGLSCNLWQSGQCCYTGFASNHQLHDIT